MKKRVFIAFNLPSSAAAELGNLIKKLKKMNPKPHIRFVKPNTLHLTLHFLGDRGNQEIIAIKKILSNTAQRCHAPTLITGQINAFPDLRSPKVVYLNIKEKTGGSLIKLQKQLGLELEKEGIDTDHRDWRPHLTLARIPSPAHFKTPNVKLPILKIPIASIELMESNLTSYGSQYIILESFTFKV